MSGSLSLKKGALIYAKNGAKQKSGDDMVKIKQYELAFIIAVAFAAGFVASNIAGTGQQLAQPEIGEERTVAMLLPAVDSEGSGVVGVLYTTVKPGTGKILLDTSKILNYLDTQLSGRIAAKAAGDYAKINLSNVDITYTIKVNASLIEGPSAGSAMAVSVLLALENRTADNITMTGTINPDGTIGPVGSVLEKARVAKENGATLFLVPRGQSVAEETSRTRVCNRMNGAEVCRINYVAQKINIGQFLGMEVREVGNIGDAYEFFTNFVVNTTGMSKGNATGNISAGNVTK